MARWVTNILGAVIVMACASPVHGAPAAGVEFPFTLPADKALLQAIDEQGRFSSTFAGLPACHAKGLLGNARRVLLSHYFQAAWERSGAGGLKRKYASADTEETLIVPRLEATCLFLLASAGYEWYFAQPVSRPGNRMLVGLFEAIVELRPVVDVDLARDLSRMGADLKRRLENDDLAIRLELWTFLEAQFRRGALLKPLFHARLAELGPSAPGELERIPERARPKLRKRFRRLRRAGDKTRLAGLRVEAEKFRRRGFEYAKGGTGNHT